MEISLPAAVKFHKLSKGWIFQQAKDPKYTFVITKVFPVEENEIFTRLI